MSAQAVENKKKVVKELKEKIDSATVLVVSDYRKVTVKEITELRKKLRLDDAEYKVVKNTLFQRAVEDAGFKDLKEHMSGPVAVLFGYKEPVAPLKSLVEFVKDAEKGEIKVGIVEKTLVDSKAIAEIAKLPPREVLLSKVVGGFQAPIYGLVNVLQGTIRKLVYALNAVKDKKGG